MIPYLSLQKRFKDFRYSQPEVENKAFSALFYMYRISQHERINRLTFKMTNDNHVTIQPLPAGATLKH